MFTGIIFSLGTVVELTNSRLTIDAPGVVNEKLGASVAIDGCCLTIVKQEMLAEKFEPWSNAAPLNTMRLSFDLLPETLAVTCLGKLKVGDKVNLEPALRAGEPLGGHLVQGHVDSVGEVFVARSFASTFKKQGAFDLQIKLPANIAALCIDKGSITINGVSLTIVNISGSVISIQLIPETQQRTNLSRLQKGQLVNLEADVIARYVQRMVTKNR